MSDELSGISLSNTNMVYYLIDPYARQAIWDLIVKYKHGILFNRSLCQMSYLGSHCQIQTWYTI